MIAQSIRKKAWPSEKYRLARPSYPPEFFALIAQKIQSLPAKEGRTAVEVGCGSGQASKGLAPLFDRLLATDISNDQIGQCPAIEGVQFKVAPAEVIDLEDSSVDAVIATQAAHWFELAKFFAEVKRVCRPHGFLFLGSYQKPRVSHPQVDALFAEFEGIIDAYYADGREHVDAGYTTIMDMIPWQRVECVTMPMPVGVNLAGLVGYLQSTSALQNYIDANGTDPLTEYKEKLSEAWPTESDTLELHFPLNVVVAQVD